MIGIEEYSNLDVDYTQILYLHMFLDMVNLHA